MREPILLPHEIVDHICNPAGMNCPCTFLRYSEDSCYCSRGTAIEDELQVIRTEAGLPPLHGNCCGYPLCIPNIIVGPDLYPPIIFIIQIGERQFLSRIPYTSWEIFREQAISRGIGVQDFVADLLFEVYKKIFRK